MAPTTDNSNRLAELKTFDEAKIGVKGLLEAGMTTLPPMFVNDSPPSPTSTAKPGPESCIPVIDLSGLKEAGPERRKEIIKEVSDITETWGFFQVVGHGIPQHVLEDMIACARRFHELDSEAKKEFYVRGNDPSKKFVYTSNFYLYTGRVTNWRDTTIAVMAPEPNHNEIPEVCRYISRDTFLEIFSEAIGLNPSHLKEMDCGEELVLLTHYYPPCPQPELAIGINKHADNDIITILLQDEIGGLQVLHDDQWLDVPHIPGALVINTGDFLQLISNDKYKSVIHKVQSKKVGPRISVACFFRPTTQNPRLFVPIKELVSEENPPIYKGTTAREYFAHYYSIGQDYGVAPALDRFKLNP